MVLAGVLLVACDPLPSTTLPQQLEQIEPIDQIEVADGDSFRAAIGGVETRFRLWGINAPEQKECYGPEAFSSFRGLAEGKAGSIVEHGRDQFDRVLAELTIDGISINERLVEEGFALGDEYLAQEEAAEESEQGIWADCISERPVRIESVTADPPGPDQENLDAELVVIGNQGDQTVDLTAWLLRDSSSRHRFTFPEWVLTPYGKVTVSSGCEESAAVIGWCSAEAVWNNEGDHALLLDAEGMIVDHLRY